MLLVTKHPNLLDISPPVDLVVISGTLRYVSSRRDSSDLLIQYYLELVGGRWQHTLIVYFMTVSNGKKK